MNIREQSFGSRWRPIAMLAVSITAAALVTATMIVANGSITLFCVYWFVEKNPDWAERRSIIQFVLFTVPMIMVVAEWILWDVIRGHLSKERYARMQPKQ
ncbi:hypothetical protein [Rhodopirellula sp. MGV]|uniref:hypothetical protein n=1 Tax=Rhodopirellula sp. MGV TaxID=2023130 RepID=UPI000BCEECEC|nr:hypothetical protein [Rhodopirellula sp. MGV]OYP33782.1 hypothetical protein CGZ80_17710 [Rhodopirellula sp. MGV]